MTRLFRYILASDTGMAPCIDHGLVTLATCPRPHPRGLLVYAGRVGRILDVAAYERTHRGRSDAVYRESADGTSARFRPDYHARPDEIRKDLSGPVLIFDKTATWYFGDRPRALPEDLSYLAAAGRSYRVNGASADDIVAFEVWLRANAAPGIIGHPSAMRRVRRCG
jgi:hypothetical protein